MDEKELTQKQQDWLALSKKIGPGPMTKSEREALENLYKEMLPREQQELFAYVQERFGKKETEPAEAEDPISVMQRKIWTPPSPALRTALSRTGSIRPRPDKERP